MDRRRRALSIGNDGIRQRPLAIRSAGTSVGLGIRLRSGDLRGLLPLPLGLGFFVRDGLWNNVGQEFEVVEARYCLLWGLRWCVSW